MNSIEQQSKKVLLVDDDKFMLQVIAKMLSSDGFVCTKAHSVDEAFGLLERGVPDLILSDYQMPGMNGFEFREKVMGDNRWKNIPFVFLTSNTDEGVMLQGLDMQVGDFLLKETPMPVIISKLNNILYNVREQHQKSIQELRSAAEALNLLSVPDKIPQVEGLNVQYWHQTFQNYPGGDFIDFIPVNDDYTFIILGDVMGKKWGAWFFSFNFLSYIRSAVRLCVFDKNLSTASILQKINNVIYLDPVLSNVLSTLSMLLIEHKTHKVLYSGAGDLPLIYFNATEQSFTRLSGSGLLLGVLPDGMYDEKEIIMNSGDKILIVSDGMIDFEDETGKKSDFEVFFNSLKAILPKEEAFDILKDVTFSKENSKIQVDDCSLIYIQKR